MAIMWEPRPDGADLVDTPAEIAWRRWLHEALTHGSVSTESQTVTVQMPDPKADSPTPHP